MRFRKDERALNDIRSCLVFPLQQFGTPREVKVHLGGKVVHASAVQSLHMCCRLFCISVCLVCNMISSVRARERPGQPNRLTSSTCLASIRPTITSSRTYTSASGNGSDALFPAHAGRFSFPDVADATALSPVAGTVESTSISVALDVDFSIVLSAESATGARGRRWMSFSSCA